jgi:hypothetical protein
MIKPTGPHTILQFGLGVKLFAWSIAILIVSVLVLTFHGLYPFELKYIDLIPERSFMYPNSSQPDPPVREFSLFSAQDSPEQYFRNVLEITAKLKKAGARVVVVPVPSTTTLDPKIQDLVRSIAAYDNVVFGDALKVFPVFQSSTEKELDAQENWWTEHPMEGIVRMSWGVSSARVNSAATLFRFVPNQYREFKKGYTVPDVAICAVRKFASIPDNGLITQHLNTVAVGSYRIPVWEDGFAYVKASIGPYLNDPIYAFVGAEKDSLTYGGQWVDGKEQPVTDSTWAILSGKIVVISWPFMRTEAEWRWIGYGRVYAQVIAAILMNRFVHRYNEWDLALVFLIIMLACALVLSVRTPLAVISMIAAQGLILYCAVWLFESHNILYDPAYVLFALALSTLILPIVKVSHERGHYKKQFENVEEHNARLEEDLLRISEALRKAKEGTGPSSPFSGGTR